MYVHKNRIRLTPCLFVTMFDDTVKLDEPKFIRWNDLCFYCLGNCELCKIKFMCWSGTIEIDESLIEPFTGKYPRPGKQREDEVLEKEAFGDVIGRIIQHAHTKYSSFTREKYYGRQTDSPVFRASELLYLNDKRQVCCKRRAKPIHHIKNW